MAVVLEPSGTSGRAAKVSHLVHGEMLIYARPWTMVPF
jgi:hypothetical protein